MLQQNVASSLPGFYFTDLAGLLARPIEFAAFPSSQRRQWHVVANRLVCTSSGGGHTAAPSARDFHPIPFSPARHRVGQTPNLAAKVAII